MLARQGRWPRRSHSSSPHAAITRRARRCWRRSFPATGRSIRLGISGSPGSGKSTFIEALGLHLIGRGHAVAVLAVDPSSSISGGSILGDKTRMERLCQERTHSSARRPRAAHWAEWRRRPARRCSSARRPASTSILVETVGVGQSETTVAGMSDVFVLLQLPNAGDDLQAIKKGIVELADIIVVNKADSIPRPRRLPATARGRAVHAQQRIAELAPAGGQAQRRDRETGSTPSGPRSNASARR